MKFLQDKFDEWYEGNQIPQNVKDMVEMIAEKVGCDIEWVTITMYNRGGQPYGWGKGISLTHCTSSMIDGPSPDYSKEMLMWLKGLKFRLENSRGDNGMDSATNWHDTFWTNELIYAPSIVFEEEFIEWEESDYND